MSDLRPTLANALQEHDVSWELRRNRGKTSRGSQRWVHIVSFTPNPHGPVMRLGLTEGGYWGIATGEDEFLEFNDGDNHLPLFPLLELPYAEARGTIAGALRDSGLSELWVQLFPFEQLTAAALRSESRFWPDYALRWVHETQLSPAIADALEYVLKEGKTQKQRHEAKRLLAVRHRSGPQFE